MTSSPSSSSDNDSSDASSSSSSANSSASYSSSSSSSSSSTSSHHDSNRHNRRKRRKLHHDAGQQQSHQDPVVINAMPPSAPNQHQFYYPYAANYFGPHHHHQQYFPHPAMASASSSSASESSPSTDTTTTAAPHQNHHHQNHLYYHHHHLANQMANGMQHHHQQQMQKWHLDQKRRRDAGGISSGEDDDDSSSSSGSSGSDSSSSSESSSHQDSSSSSSDGEESSDMGSKKQSRKRKYTITNNRNETRNRRDSSAAAAATRKGRFYQTEASDSGSSSGDSDMYSTDSSSSSDPAPRPHKKRRNRRKRIRKTSDKISDSAEESGSDSGTSTSSQTSASSVDSRKRVSRTRKRKRSASPDAAHYKDMKKSPHHINEPTASPTATSPDSMEPPIVRRRRIQARERKWATLLSSSSHTSSLNEHTTEPSSPDAPRKDIISRLAEWETKLVDNEVLANGLPQRNSKGVPSKLRPSFIIKRHSYSNVKDMEYNEIRKYPLEVEFHRRVQHFFDMLVRVRGTVARDIFYIGICEKDEFMSLFEEPSPDSIHAFAKEVIYKHNCCPAELRQLLSARVIGDCTFNGRFGQFGKYRGYGKALTKKEQKAMGVEDENESSKTSSGSKADSLAKQQAHSSSSDNSDSSSSEEENETNKTEDDGPTVYVITQLVRNFNIGDTLHKLFHVKMDSDDSNIIGVFSNIPVKCKPRFAAKKGFNTSYAAPIIATEEEKNGKDFWSTALNTTNAFPGYEEDEENPFELLHNREELPESRLQHYSCSTIGRENEL